MEGGASPKGGVDGAPPDARGAHGESGGLASGGLGPGRPGRMLRDCPITELVGENHLTSAMARGSIERNPGNSRLFALPAGRRLSSFSLEIRGILMGQTLSIVSMPTRAIAGHLSDGSSEGSPVPRSTTIRIIPPSA